MISDKQSIMNVLGSLLKEPHILSETDKYQLENNDFPERFHKIIFAAIHNLYKSGSEVIDVAEIDGFISQYSVQYEVFNQNDGVDYLHSIQEITNLDNFDYHYNKVKKLSLLREMNGLGFDISEIYDESILDPREQEKMMKKFDEMSIKDILLVYEEKMVEVKDKFESKAEMSGIHAGDGIVELLQKLKENPDIGLPLNSEMLTNVCLGARLSRLFLRSLASGHGKSRNSLADFCKLSAKGWYDSDKKEWVQNEFDVGSLFISTEMTFEELQTPLLAYISDVEEDKIKLGRMTKEEEERVFYAANIVKESRMYFEYLPDFSVEDIERTIEKNIIKHDVEYVFHDYLHSSIGILSGFAKKSGINLREDQILLLMSDKLKQLANKFEVFIMTSTQLNDGWKEAWRKGQEIDQSFISSAKSIVNKVDFAAIMLPISQKEKKEIKELSINTFGKTPNYVTHVFKNRGGKHTNVKIFSYVNMGTMRVDDLFVTDNLNSLVHVDKLEIHNKEKQEEGKRKNVF